MGKKPFQKRGARIQEAKEYEEEVIEIKRVTRVVKGGRRLRFRATVVIGNRNGKVGIGMGKSTEVTGAIQKAISQAKKHVKIIRLNEGTIPHEVRVKYKSARLLLLPAGPGTGLIAGGTVRKILDLVGIKNILSKSIGSSNKVNNTYATIEALEMLKETPMMIRKKAAPMPAPVPAPLKTPVKTEKPEIKKQAKPVKKDIKPSNPKQKK